MDLWHNRVVYFVQQSEYRVRQQIWHGLEVSVVYPSFREPSFAFSCCCENECFLIFAGGSANHAPTAVSNEYSAPVRSTAQLACIASGAAALRGRGTHKSGHERLM
mmetsp:Transcript_32776/g.101523  ORF Transcript_32776/g.101523 Transcript_32776/m.101523 type:complete len:106 (-) Transcript_32776:2890-3207(-)